MASFRNLILVSLCLLRRSCFVFFLSDLFSKSNRGYFLHGNSFFFQDNPEMIQMLSMLGEKLEWRKKKNSNQVNPQVSPRSLGVELRPQLHVRRRVLPLHLLSFPPRKFPENIQPTTDCRSYQYAGLTCNAAPQLKAPWEGLMFKFLTKSQIIFSLSPAACLFLNKVHISYGILSRDC